MSTTKNMSLNWNSSMKKKIEKDSDNFWHRKLALKVKFWHFFDTSPLTQFSKFNNFLWVCWFLGTIFQILYTPVEKSTTRILYSSVPSNSIYWMGHLILKFNLLGVWFDPQIQFSNFSCMFLNPNNFFQFEF